uniref:Uncharacterized protein n=1 Tax=Ananas comosus var. bracteatus TaxID=296719 RepID=A0A6V7Q8M1_ANACO|nr:unnamed protein product [Ananas comosus var. bracteatus]
MCGMRSGTSCYDAKRITVAIHRTPGAHKITKVVLRGLPLIPRLGIQARVQPGKSRRAGHRAHCPEHARQSRSTVELFQVWRPSGSGSGRGWGGKTQRRRVADRNGGGHTVQQIEGITVLTFKLVEELRIARSCERGKTVPYAVKQGAQGLRPAAGGLPAGATAGVGRGGGGEPRAPLGRRQEATVATATTALGELPAHINVPRVQVLAEQGDQGRRRPTDGGSLDRTEAGGGGGERWRADPEPQPEASTTGSKPWIWVSGASPRPPKDGRWTSQRPAARLRGGAAGC